MVKSWETEEKLQNITNEKKVKKVIKGLEKASKTHAKQAKILKSGLKVFKARGGRMQVKEISDHHQEIILEASKVSHQLEILEVIMVVIEIQIQTYGGGGGNQLHLQLQVKKDNKKRSCYKRFLINQIWILLLWLLMQLEEAFMMLKKI